MRDNKGDLQFDREDDVQSKVSQLQEVLDSFKSDDSKSIHSYRSNSANSENNYQDKDETKMPDFELEEIDLDHNYQKLSDVVSKNLETILEEDV